MEILKIDEFVNEGFFNKHEEPKNEYEVRRFISRNNLKFNKRTGLYDCNGNIRVTNSDLNEDGGFPVKFGKVKGNFDCSDCDKLVSLEGAPVEVGKDFKCSHCTKLTSLKGSPKKVGNMFSCLGCSSLKSLVGGPKEVGRMYVCSYCDNLVSLDGAMENPVVIFRCSNCKNLRTLTGLPDKLNGTLDCSNTAIKNFDNAPIRIKGNVKCEDCYNLVTFTGLVKVDGDIVCKGCNIKDKTYMPKVGGNICK